MNSDMNRLVYKDWKALNAKLWHSAVRQYFIQCAERVIDLAPLPEFKDALEILKLYDADPSDAHRNHLKKIYREFCRHERMKRAAFGYTALGEFYRGILHIVYTTIHPKNFAMSGSTAGFAEAVCCAVRDSRVQEIDQQSNYDLARRVMKTEYDEQHKIWEQVFAKLRERTGENWEEYQARFAKAA